VGNDQGFNTLIVHAAAQSAQSAGVVHINSKSNSPIEIYRDNLRHATRTILPL
jgi:hypothetical protein